MKPQSMVRPSDCLATALAAMLDIEATDLPHTGREPWSEAWEELRQTLASLGWRISYTEWPIKGTSILDLLTVPDSEAWDEIERSLLWLVGITHPSFSNQDHVIVIQNNEIVFDPGGDVLKRPPLNELVVTGSFMLSPLDPGRFTLRDA